jgi:hypothetical protein
MKDKFEEHYLQYWDIVKDVVDENGWVYSKETPHLLDAYFESNTGKEIEFEKSYQDPWKGTRWRPKSLSNV